MLRAILSPQFAGLNDSVISSEDSLFSWDPVIKLIPIAGSFS
jgi:hypothetical protein